MSEPATGAGPRPPTRPAVGRHAPKLLASLLIGAGFVWMLRRGGLPLVPDRGAFSGLRWWAVPGYAAAMAMTTAIRVHRWAYLLRPISALPLRRVIGVGLIGLAAVVFAPLRMGELLRPYLISDRGEVSFSQAAGTVGAERIIDGLVLALTLLVGLQLSTPLSPLPDHLGKLPLPVAAVPASAYAALTLFLSAFVAMALFYWRRDFARKATAAVVGLVSDRLASWLTHHVEKVAEGLSFLPDTRHSLPFLRSTLAFWCSNALAMWVLMRGCGVEASFTQALVAMGVLGVGIVVPAGPGFFGAFQLSIYSALAMFFPEPVLLGPGSAYVFLLYLGSLGSSLIGLAVGAWLERSAEPRPGPQS